MGSLALAPLDFYKKKLPHFIYEAGQDHMITVFLSHEVLRYFLSCPPLWKEAALVFMQEAMKARLYR